MKLKLLSPLILLACSTSAPSPSNEANQAPPLGSSNEALRQLGKQDADDVQSCRRAALRCEESVADSGASGVCDQINEHCDDLEAQLAQVRAEFEQCLASAAQCEQTATDPAQCQAARDACAPAHESFRNRRGATLQCADRAEQCFTRGVGLNVRFRPQQASDAGADADAGAQVCDDSAFDFVGCCHGGHGGGGADAGANIALNPNRRFGPGPGPGAFRPGFGFGKPGDRNPGRPDQAPEADAGVRFGAGPGRR
jgi:hypothetical protein